jgi:hypothetical protein
MAVPRERDPAVWISLTGNAPFRGMTYRMPLVSLGLTRLTTSFLTGPLCFSMIRAVTTGTCLQRAWV